MPTCAPLNSGTGLYRFEDGTRFDREQEIRGNKDFISNCSQDVTKWELVDKVGNVFNRLVIFNANHFHSSMDYFGLIKLMEDCFRYSFFN